MREEAAITKFFELETGCIPGETMFYLEDGTWFLLTDGVRIVKYVGDEGADFHPPLEEYEAAMIAADKEGIFDNIVPSYVHVDTIGFVFKNLEQGKGLLRWHKDCTGKVI